MSGRTDHVVVVGAGLAGLSAALHLLGAGRRVTVVESASHPGGRAGLLDAAGYRVDTGPTVLTMPEVVADALGAVGESLADRLDLVPLHPAYQARFADGSALAVHSDAAAMEAEVRRFAGPREAAGYRRLRRWLTELYEAQFDRFIAANLGSPLDLMHPAAARLVALGGLGRLGPAVGRHLRDERLRRVFSFQALYAGLSPQRAMAAYGVIAYLDTVGGVWFPKGGMRALPRALADAAAAHGAEFRYDSPVRRLERVGDRVRAVHTDQERIECDAVVLTPDLPVAYRLLGRTPRRLVPLRWSPSAVVLHLGVASGAQADPAHHVISFGGAWRRTFREIIDEGRLMSDPSLLVTRPTVTDPTLAPDGRELLYLLAPAPNLAVGRQDWARIGPAYRDELIAVATRRGLLIGEPDIDLNHLVTPRDWAEGGHGAGTPFSLAHTLSQTGPFRPGNRVAGTVNVALAGSGTTPGVGVPTALISGKLAAARVTGIPAGPGRSRQGRTHGR
ncbi:phytoene desaturase [Actinoalloteichus sp. GBA129-24]|uniref:Phytoene desaturase n=2 Tax=Pseudonocardiaceae TaxID=2070 RepID=A0AAC9PRL6_9PSEU|nr:phytoene desaturase [Actinoalloteichus fjordicus]APU20039.1 phytoene desaturase [Actinoalloteichus sp. GBA129-24]